jgi:hypothetical protein
MNDPQLYEIALTASIGLYVVTALAGVFLLMHVISQAMNDLHLNRTDAPAVIRDRKRAFFGDAVFLTLTVCLRNYWIVHPIVGVVASGLVGGGLWILTVNVRSLRDRAPRSQPPTSSRVHAIGAFLADKRKQVR